MAPKSASLRPWRQLALCLLLVVAVTVAWPPPGGCATPSGRDTAASSCATGERLFTVVNSSNQAVWLGFASGSISCLSDSNCPTQAKGSCIGASPPNAGVCGCTGGCGAISTCNPADSFCHWNGPSILSGSIDMATGSTTKLCFPAAQTGMAIQWSGTLFARTGCSSTAPCQTGDCGASPSTSQCPLAKGGAPPATLAEFTLSNPATTGAGPDFYDVSIINGINVGVTMAPNAGTFSADPTDPYSCGAPGNPEAAGKLSACSWQITPIVSKVDQAPFLRNVAPTSFQAAGKCPNGSAPNSLGNCACTTDTDCAPGPVCGLAMNASTSAQFAQVCGTAIGWWTADQICGASAPVAPFGAPLQCGTSFSNSDGSTSTYTNLFACTQPSGATNPEQAQSCYSSGAVTDCCGCATSASADHQAWPTVLSPSFGGPDNGCFNNNPTWVSVAQPWLVFLKKACPTAYTYPFDDATSTFTCSNSSGQAAPSYTITFLPTS
ncbi:MAG: thaumatin family protein [Thermoanaerobaculia bacterium]|nr:thaumatin family protein [Thermoanaerobaculia bacterium]